MSLLIANLSNVLEKVIAPSIQSQLFETNFLLKWLPKNVGVQKMDNNQFNITLIKGRNPSVGTIPATSTTLPTDMADITAQTTVDSKYTFGVLRFDDRVIEATKSDKGALAMVAELYGDQLRKDLAKEMNRQFFGKGDKVLTITNGAVNGSATVTVDSTEYLIAGQYVKCGAGVVRKISSVDSSTQITLDDVVTCADDAAVVRYISSTVAADDMMGLSGIIDDGVKCGTLQSIVRATSPWWNSYVSDSATALTEDAMILAVLSAKKYASPDDEYAIFMGPTLWRKYGGLLTNVSGNPRTFVNQKDYDGGWNNLTFMGGAMDVNLDYDCPEGYVFVVNRNTLSLAQLTPVGFMQGTNGVLSRVTGSTEWESVLRFYGNLAARACRPNAALRSRT
jgi:hypothetical protein